MMRTIDKYHRCNYSAIDAGGPICETQSGYQEYLKLKTRVEVLQRSQRNLLGEDLAPLSTKELEQLEGQLEMSLKQIRTTKTQCMMDQLADLQKREQALAEMNKALIKKLDEMNSEIPQRQPWETGQQCHYGRFPSQSEAFFQPLYSHSALQIGYNPQNSGMVNTVPSSQNLNGYLPGWML
ncbi:hypothetical protein Droror1_Dr00012074 [Drosera rotundifolia]